MRQETSFDRQRCKGGAKQSIFQANSHSTQIIQMTSSEIEVIRRISEYLDPEES